MNRFPVAVLCTALLVLPAASAGQTITGRVTASENRGPLVGAFVRLYDESGVHLAAVLTNAQGDYRLAAPGPGRYRVRTEFIGREVAELGVIELREDIDIAWSPSLAPKPVEIEGLDVEGVRRCAMSTDEGSRISDIWDEARKALEVAAWASEQELFRYTLMSRQRELDLDRSHVTSERSEQKAGYYRAPFVARPAADLMTAGFVQRTADATFVYAPDASVLLDDAFLAAHCFRIASVEENRIGLAFEPVRDRQLPDIQGVMWLDSRTAELQSVEFRYRRYPEVDNALHLGGHVDFERLPTGAWIIRRWAIEMPIRADVRRAGTKDVTDRRIIGIMEQGAEVLTVTSRSGVPVFVADRATLSGLVFDSIRGVPLSGAEVRLAGTAWSSVTAEDGTFQIAGLPDGSFSLEVSHPRLDSLGLKFRSIPLELVTGETTRRDVAVPRSVTAGPDEALRIEGEVLDATSRAGIEAARVSLVDEAGQAVATASTGRKGSYTIRAPQPGHYRVRTEVEGRETVTSDPFAVDPDNRVFHSLLFDAGPVLPDRSRQSGVVVATDRSGAAADGPRVVGTVEGMRDGKPLPQVLIRVADHPPVLSDARGRFTLTGVSPGRYPIEVEMVGRKTLRDTLVLADVPLSNVRIVLAEAPIALDPLRVEVESRSPILDLAGFYDRRDFSGINGWRITREEIEKHPGARVSDLLSTIPGTFLLYPGLSYPGYPPGSAILRVNRPGNRYRALDPRRVPGCEPTVFVDGIEYIDDATALTHVKTINFLSPDAIEGIEVYTGLTSPAQFRAEGCGVVLIWTRAGLRR